MQRYTSTLIRSTALRPTIAHATRTSPLYRPSYALQQRQLHWWKIPVALMTASPTQRRAVLAGVVGTSVLAGLAFGPSFFFLCGGVAAFMAWRLWRKTTQWWQYLPLTANNTQSLYAALKTKVGQHRAEDQVRANVIHCIQQWASSDQGRHVLTDHFQLDHVNDLSFLPTHARSSLTTSTTTPDHQTHMHTQLTFDFWMESANEADNGGCMISCQAVVNDDTGHIQLKQIILSSPYFQQQVPLQPTQPHGRVIEGEFRDINAK
ncbi:hypothetical protein DM01DRAFT_1101149 [Hesseltinella vesiculosa]|uniref:Uncharacterized protein n=1 Tax=Hesseltinella vesiculosa TaxID=101127 RepID=A0A1X2GBD6_9FUNG|nr:hypothetical protein DM01DRAFT_1101149 [Hesseltinella vesiculosa]